MRNPFIFLVVISFGIAILFGCQGNEKSPLSTKHNDALKDAKVGQTLGHFDKVIATVGNDKITFVVNADEIKSSWAKVVNFNSDLNVSYTEVSITEEANGYYLRGLDKVNHVSSLVKLVLDGNKLYEAIHEIAKGAGGGLTVSCSGCESTGGGSAGKCSVSLLPGVGYYCSDCSVGTCVKTETYTSGGGVLR